MSIWRWRRWQPLLTATRRHRTKSCPDCWIRPSLPGSFRASALAVDDQKPAAETELKAGRGANSDSTLVVPFGEKPTAVYTQKQTEFLVAAENLKPRRATPMALNRGHYLLRFLGVLAFSLAPLCLRAQHAGAEQPSETHGFSYQSGSSVFKAYSYPRVQPQSLRNSAKLAELIQNSKLELSLEDTIQLALQNNLDIAVARFQLPLAQLDLL